MFRNRLVDELQNEIVEHYNKQPSQELELCSDSRKFESAMAFIAIKGPSFDGAKFIFSVLDKGCPFAIVNKDSLSSEELIKIKSQYTETEFLVVKNTIDFLQKLAVARRDEWVEQGGRIIGITGSNGKTTTKEMIYFLLDSLFPKKVLKTKGNLNNHLGVPFTLLDLKDSQEYAIVEMGTNHPGEIGALCELSKPHHGIITSIGKAHLEFFESIDNILIEKSALFNFVRDNGFEGHQFLLNSLDEKLKQLQAFKGCIDLGRDYSYVLSNGKIVVSSESGDWTFENQFLKEEYNIQNLVAAALLIDQLFPSRRVELTEAISNFQMPKLNRSEWIIDGNKKIFLDAYNANPTSMEKALDSFAKTLSKEQVAFEDALIVLGDMKELGPDACGLHKELGQFSRKLGFKKALFIGAHGKDYAEGFGFDGAVCCDNVADAKIQWDEQYKTCQYFFLKASRSLQLESILDIK